MPKSKKEHKMSERKKYLRTLMAEMGLSSLDQLSKEEQRRWRRAAEPQKIVQKKLKEMGYSLNSDNNKRSLGRISKIVSFKKIASKVSIEDLKSLISPEAYSAVFPVAVPMFGVSGYFDKEKYIQDSLRIIRENSSSPINERKITNVLEGLADNLTKFLPFDMDKAFSDDPNKSFDLSELPDRNKKEIIAQLVAAKQLSSLDPSDKELLRAIKLIQKNNNLKKSGLIDKETLSAIENLERIAPDAASTKATPDKKDSKKSLRSRREEIKKRRRGQAGGGFFDRSSLRNIRIPQYVRMEETKPELKSFILILDKIAGDLGIAFKVSSAYRSPMDQARVMYNNYKKAGGDGGQGRSYLLKLYGNKITKIADVYESSQSDKSKLKEVEKILIDEWPPTGHGLGNTMDIAGTSQSNFDEMFSVARQYADFKTDWEDAFAGNAHYHVKVHSIKSEPQDLIS